MIQNDFSLAIATAVKGFSACTNSIYIPSLLPKQTMHQGYMNVWCVSLAYVFVQSAGYVNPLEVSYTPFYLHAVTVPT